MYTIFVSLTPENAFTASPIVMLIWDSDTVSKSSLAMRISPEEARDMATKLMRMADAVEKKRASMPAFANAPTSHLA
jgi:hypothetical protein